MLVDPRDLGDRIDQTTELDALVKPLERAAGAIPEGMVKDALHGVMLGHPLHPLLTDLPIGFWTSAWVLDLVGGKRSAAAAQTLVGLGVLSVVPTAAAGLADWSELNTPERRSGAVHAVVNIGATALFAASYVARRRGHRGTGVALGMAGAAAASMGGYLGGHLTFRRASGVNHVPDPAAASEWTPIEGSLPADGEVGTGQLDDTRLALASLNGTPHALAAVCSHAGGPLDEGELVDGCLRCPWHGSEFRLTDGRVARGPATAPQPAYDIRTSDTGGLEARRVTP